MGPITLVDKSFLQSISVDESVWFDQYFKPVICPLFYVETLGDLAKPATVRGPADGLVGMIASKFPEMEGVPCSEHAIMVVNNLLGHPLPMRGQIPVPGGRHVRVGETIGAVYDDSPEAKAFSRWRKREFLEIEREYARGYRERLNNLNLPAVAKSIQALGIDGQKFKALAEIRTYVAQLVSAEDGSFDRLQLAVELLAIPPRYHQQIIERWLQRGKPSLEQFAPYASFVVEIELFFRFALAASLISADRPSNRTDIAYLFYLPFCQIFVSSDKLQQRCAPLFMRKDQQFVWGISLKDDLEAINNYYLSLPIEVREQGIHKWANTPPKSHTGIVGTLWDEYHTSWRTETKSKPASPEADKALAEHLTSFSKAPSIPISEVDMDRDLDMVSLTHMVSRKKGNWYQVDKSIPDPPDDEK